METSGKQKPRAKVMRMEEAFWELPPGHVQAYSKLLVHPSNADTKYLDFRISSYQPKGYAEVHLHEVAENLYYILQGKGIVELDPFGPNVANKNIRSTIVATIANPRLFEDLIGGSASIDPAGLS